VNVDIALRHIENPPPSIKEYIRDKLQRLDRFERLVSRIRVVASDEHTHDHDARYLVEAVVRLPHGHEVVAKACASCLFEATDSLADRLEKQVVRYKDKVTYHHQRSRSQEAQ
jgi:putative sigma-54 modulation protein